LLFRAGQTLFSKLLNEDAGLLATTDDLRKMLKKLEDINKPQSQRVSECKVAYRAYRSCTIVMT